MPARRRSPRSAVPLEKVEQAHVIQAAESVGGVVIVIGTVRRGSKCPSCGAWVQGHMGTQQTPGLADLEIYLPVHSMIARSRELVKWETKRAKGGRFSPEQVTYRDTCTAAGVTYGSGCLDDFLSLLVDRGLVKADNIPHYRRQETPDGRSRDARA